MLDFLAAPENMPFTAVLTLLLVMFLIEVFGLLVGTELGGLLGEVDLPELGADPLPEGVHLGLITSFLYWLNIGRVPIIIVLVMFMTSFVVFGFAIQYAALAILGTLIHAAIAGVAAFLLAIPVVRSLGRRFSTVIPRDETEVLSSADLVGSRAVITIGVARKDFPAQARVTDKYETSHLVMLEPDEPEAELQAGEPLLLVRYDGRRFYAIAHPEP